MNIPPELDHFAVQVALVPPDQWDSFKAAAGRHALGTAANMAHAVNAFANQWTRKQRVPNSHVAALLALLDPAKRDRLNAQSWTVKKWVAGNRAGMLKAARLEAQRRFHARVVELARAFMARAMDERVTLLDMAMGHLAATVAQRYTNPVAAAHSAVVQTRGTMRWRTVAVGDGRMATDWGAAIAEAHNAGTLEKLLTEWETAG